MEPSTYTCSTCNTSKPLTEYYLYNNGKYKGKRRFTWCKRCSCDKVKEYAKNNKERVLAKSRDYHHRNRERLLPKMKERNVKSKQKVMEHYSGNPPHCQCPGGCSEKHIAFLAIDHIDGGGTKHKESVKASGGNSYYRWIVNNKFPDGLRVLCHNCNLGRQVNGGTCPHEQNDTGVH